MGAERLQCLEEGPSGSGDAVEGMGVLKLGYC